MVHIKIINGEYVRKSTSTLMEAAEELAKEKHGQVLFACPNYAVVATNSQKVDSELRPLSPTLPVEEVTVWMK